MWTVKKVYKCYSTSVTYLNNLNDAQRDAVLHTNGPVSVLAGAGSGKTRVLTTRIYHLIRQNIPAQNILAVTFTNKAAREMRERIRSLLGEDFGNDVPFIGTFHGLGRELLQAYGRSIGVPRFFSISDRSDSERIVSKALKSLDVDTKELSPRNVLSRISKAKNAGLSAVTFRERHGRSSFGNRVTADVWDVYETTLKKEKSLDFDDLLVRPLELLEGHPDILEIVQNRWSHIHIDEYQDTNTIQARLAKLLAGKHNNIFVVGDGDQAIYGWRGAKMENILQFEKEYAGASTIVLEHNYRSSKNLVDTANAVIAKNKNRKEKHSITSNPEGDPIIIHMAGNAGDEARFVATKITTLIQEGSKPEDIAILFRTNAQSRALEEVLLYSNVPYKLLGTRFFDRKEVKDVLAWIRLSLEPTREADRMRATQFPPRGIGKTTLGKLVAGKREELRPSDEKKVSAFENLINELSEEARTAIPSAFVRSVVEKSGMRSALAEGTEEERDRFENIQELVALATRYDSIAGEEGISSFLADTALASDQDELDRKQEAGGVTLMTIHAAKGLEFDTVFIVGMEEGLFPHEGIGEKNRDNEEERRLFYVAITRAKIRLFMTLARVRNIYGTDYLQEPSSFLADIDKTLVQYDDTGNEMVIM